MPSVEGVLGLFQSRGGSQYGGEQVTQLEHALQSAALAEAEEAPAVLIVAALLHDIGHLLHDLPANAPDVGVDDRHEASGYQFVRSLYADEVAEPIRLHVPAKRYLCAVDSEYQRCLSQPSIVSLNLQGGPMSPLEVRRFEQNPFFQSAVRLRRWDDAAKIPEFPTPPLSHFAELLHQLALKGPQHEV